MRRVVPWVGGAALVAVPFVYHEPYPLHIMVIGAYVVALLWNDLQLTPWIGIPLAMLATAVIALLVAYPCFRFRIIGHYFALVTLALSAIVQQVIIATRDYTGGSLGYTPNRYHDGNSVYALQF